MGVESVDVTVWQHLDGPTWTQVGVIDDITSSMHEPRRLQSGPWTLQMPATQQTLPLVSVATKRLFTFEYRGKMFTGVVGHVGQESDDQGNQTVDLSGLDAMSLLGRVLCWPVPDQGLDAQGVARWTTTGNVEDVLTQLISANYSRDFAGTLYEAVVAPSQGRGGPATPPPSLRFHNLLDRVTAWCSNHGLGLSVGLVPHSDVSTRADLTISFHEPKDQSNRVYLSPELGTARAWSQADDAPTATRAIVAGGGVGAARIFRLVIDTDAEAVWGNCGTVFVDARDTSDPATLDARGLEELTNATAQSAFDLTAAEVKGTRYGDHFVVGDWVTINLPGVDKVTTLGAATIETGSEGVTVAFVPGDPDTSATSSKKKAAVAPWAPVVAKIRPILQSLSKSVQNLQQEP